MEEPYQFPSGQNSALPALAPPNHPAVKPPEYPRLLVKQVDAAKKAVVSAKRLCVMCTVAKMIGDTPLYRAYLPMLNRQVNPRTTSIVRQSMANNHRR